MHCTHHHSSLSSTLTTLDAPLEEVVSTIKSLTITSSAKVKCLTTKHRPNAKGSYAWWLTAIKGDKKCGVEE